MNPSEFIKTYLAETSVIAQQLDAQMIEKALHILLQVKKQGARLFFVGVGGGAGTGSHAANDFNKIAQISTFCLSDNPSLLTALANDEGWEAIFKRQLQMHKLNSHDCIFIFSVGGGNQNVSSNLVSAIGYAKEVGAKIIGVVGSDTGATAKLADACIFVPLLHPDRKTPHTESFQLVINHLLSNAIYHIAKETISDNAVSKIATEKKAIFLDRDGVINNMIMRGDVVSSPRNMEEFSLIPEVAQCLADFKAMGFLNIVFTNQPDIARGLLLQEDLANMHAIITKAMPVDSIIYCPHDNGDNCACRKPKPGMILQTAKNLSLDLSSSYVIGDSEKDISAGKFAGCKTFFIKKAYNENSKKEYDFEVGSLQEAVNMIKTLTN